MTAFPEGNALVYCEGAFETLNGKTAHGLVRRTRRYRVLGVIDSHVAGRDAGEVLDGRPSGIPIYGSVKQGLGESANRGLPATHLVIGIAPDGGRLDKSHKGDVLEAIRHGLNVDSGLHDFLSEDPEAASLAAEHGIVIRDVRKPPSRDELHFFSGKIEQVSCLKVAVLGTDSAIGKRTTAWKLEEGLRAAGCKAELVGTGQTAWMQGVRYGVIMDTLVNDFVAGEIEHAVWTAWQEARPDVILIEGQGSLMNPAYPGGFEILAAGRPDVVVLQHAPARVEYDGFPGYPLHPIETQIHAIELISGKPVVALSINHEHLSRDRIPEVCTDLAQRTGLPVSDLLVEDGGNIISVLMSHLKNEPKGSHGS